MPDSTDGPLRRFVARVPTYLGSAFAASYGAQTGDAVTGVVVGQMITDVGSDFVERVLSPRQEARVERVMRLAVEKVQRSLQDGTSLRDDGMLGSAEGAEVFEAVALAARDSFEEKKIPYLANLFAAIAVVPQVDASTAHLLIKEAESLSWTELCLLSIVQGRDDVKLPDVELHRAGHPDWVTWTPLELLKRMADSNRYIYSPQLPPKPTPPGGIPYLPETDFRLSALRPTNLGRLLGSLMELKSIPAEDLSVIDHAMTVAAASAEQDEDEAK